MWDSGSKRARCRVMCVCGPVKPGEERKPWVGERVHAHECECRVEKQRCEMRRTMTILNKLMSSFKDGI